MARGLQKAQAQKKALEKAAKMKAKGSSQLKTKNDAMNIKCKICMQTFMCTAKVADLKVHAENKHSKKTFKDCFPDKA